jgi:hypothetical protein
MAECTDKESFDMLTAGEEWFSPEFEEHALYDDLKLSVFF